MSKLNNKKIVEILKIVNVSLNYNPQIPNLSPIIFLDSNTSNKNAFFQHPFGYVIFYNFGCIRYCVIFS